MPAHVFYSNHYDALIASRKLDETLMNFDVQECNMENQFKLVIIPYIYIYIIFKINFIVIYYIKHYTDHCSCLVSLLILHFVDKIVQVSNGIGLVFIALGEFTTTFSFGKIIGYNHLKIVLNIPQIFILTFCTAWLVHLLSWFVWALTEIECLKKVSKLCISSTLKYI